MKWQFLISLFNNPGRWVLSIFLIGFQFPPVYSQVYKVENGSMVIEIPLNIVPSQFLGFIQKFNLKDIGLTDLLANGREDSLLSGGWKVSKQDGNIYRITRPFESLPAAGNPEGKFLLFLPSHFDQRFPSIPEGLRGGVNYFKDGAGFSISDSVVHFSVSGYSHAKQVFLAGSFNNWAPMATPMRLEGENWVLDVIFKPGKYWYKYVIDGKWKVDPQNKLRENDGEGNTNSVFYMPNFRFKLLGYSAARKVNLAGSFNDWQQWPMQRFDSGWYLNAFMAKGTHTYRFVVDGNWMEDPLNPKKFPNEFGEYNSVVEIGNATTFRLNGYLNARSVILSGNFNGWRGDELNLEKVNDGWETKYVLGPGNYWYNYIVDGNVVVDSTRHTTNFGNKGLLKNLMIVDPNYQFKLMGYGLAKTVTLAGDFNDFNPSSLKMRKEGDSWVVNIHLNPGKHIYKFIVDGNWIRDPANPEWEQNSYNTGNSVIWIEPKTAENR